MPHLDIAAENFDRWMKEYEESHRDKGHLDDKNKALIAFLNGDQGFRYVKTYEELCQLSVLLQQKGYKTTNPPCELIDFANAIDRANPKSFGGAKPVIPESARKQLAVEQEQREERVLNYFSQRVNEIGAIENPEDKQIAMLSLGLIANNLFKKNTKYQPASCKEGDSVEEKHQFPSLTNSGYGSDSD